MYSTLKSTFTSLSFACGSSPIAFMKACVMSLCDGSSAIPETTAVRGIPCIELYISVMSACICTKALYITASMPPALVSLASGIAFSKVCFCPVFMFVSSILTKMLLSLASISVCVCTSLFSSARFAATCSPSVPSCVCRPDKLPLMVAILLVFASAVSFSVFNTCTSSLKLSVAEASARAACCRTASTKLTSLASKSFISFAIHPPMLNPVPLYTCRLALLAACRLALANGL